jgi:predicted nucleotidyltransferase
MLTKEVILDRLAGEAEPLRHFGVIRIQLFGSDARDEQREVSDIDFRVDAIPRNLEVIGEAVTNIPNEVKASYPDVPWKERCDELPRHRHPHVLGARRGNSLGHLERGAQPLKSALR